VDIGITQTYLNLNKVTTATRDSFFGLVNSRGWCNFFIEKVIRKCKGKRMQLV
jgi:hypothetical protein